jgi:hypothetical protein
LKVLHGFKKILKNELEKEKEHTSVMMIGDYSTSLASRFFRTSLSVVMIDPGFRVFTTFNKYYLSLKLLLTRGKLLG